MDVIVTGKTKDLPLELPHTRPVIKGANFLALVRVNSLAELPATVEHVGHYDEQGNLVPVSETARGKYNEVHDRAPKQKEVEVFGKLHRFTHTPPQKIGEFL